MARDRGGDHLDLRDSVREASLGMLRKVRTLVFAVGVLSVKALGPLVLARPAWLSG